MGGVVPLSGCVSTIKLWSTNILQKAVSGEVSVAEQTLVAVRHLGSSLGLVFTLTLSIALLPGSSWGLCESEGKGSWSSNWLRQDTAWKVFSEGYFSKKAGES